MSEGEGDYPVEAPGWAAIDRALAKLYPGAQPHQFTSRTPYEPGSRSPLPAVSVHGAEGPRHWHFVTYGLSELFEKSSPHPDVSGFGYELTFRLPRGADEDQPPAWPIRMLQGIGAHVLAGEATLDTGDRLALGGPIHPDGHTKLTGLVAVPDWGLGKIDTTHGSVLFLQLVGLTDEELDMMSGWDLARVVGCVGELAPRGVTDVARTPWTDHPDKAPVLRRYRLGVMI